MDNLIESGCGSTLAEQNLGAGLVDGVAVPPGAGDTFAVTLRVYGADLGNVPGCWTCPRSGLFPPNSSRADHT